MVKLLQSILRVLARAVLKKYQPKVVGISGSIGKTSAKEAIFTVLSSERPARHSVKSYNNELGVPLTIIGAESGGRNPLKWLAVLGRAIRLLIIRDKQYPELLVLELGADHPGDTNYLLSFVECTVGVLTAIAPVHLEFFGDLDGVAKEESTLVRRLPATRVAVLNADDPLVMAASAKVKAAKLTYGFTESAEVRAYEERVSGQQMATDGVESIRGVSFKVSYQGSTVPVFLPSSVGRHSVNAALAAIAVGVSLGMNLVRISENLRQYRPPRGRMNLIDGIKYTLIIDDTYNSSPNPALAALDVLHQVQLPGSRHKYAVLGDMLELGTYTDRAHLEVGRKVAELGINYLVTVGEKSRLMANAAIGVGMAKDRVWSFDKAAAAGIFLQDRIEQGDLILVKGSQGVRMERIVKELMAEPLRAEELLCRHDPKWLAK
ncbi:MAG: UDP-N-acetylmuramoyl-tripeptide--D-alanyl-D-alanine ligase [Patescibacteria group bacterium]